jgi:hypothetical protein
MLAGNKGPASLPHVCDRSRTPSHVAPRGARILLPAYIADYAAFVKFYEWSSLAVFVFGMKNDAMRKYFIAIFLVEVILIFSISKKTGLKKT